MVKQSLPTPKICGSNLGVPSHKPTHFSLDIRNNDNKEASNRPAREVRLTLNLLDDVDGPDEDTDTVETLGLVGRVLPEQEGVVPGKVGVVLHANASPGHPEDSPFVMTSTGPI